VAPLAPYFLILPHLQVGLLLLDGKLSESLEEKMTIVLTFETLLLSIPPS